MFIGSEQNNPGGLFSAGSVYRYGAQSGSQVDKLVASDGQPNDELGAAVAAGGGVVVSGAPRPDDPREPSVSASPFATLP